MTDDNPNIDRPDQGAAGEAPTEPQPTEQQPTEPQAPGPRRLQRSSNDRVLVGVAGGLGSYFGVDPVIFRIGFALSVFFGGLGALAYLLLAVFVPTDGEPDRAQRARGRLQAMGIWRGLGLVALVLVAIGGLFALAGGAAFAVALGWGVPVAIVIIAIGGLIAIAALRGGGARWLIAPAIALAMGAGVAAASDVDIRGGIGERDYRPLSADSIPADGYELGLGHLVVDLRGLDWSEERVVDLDVDLGVGQIEVFVPERVCVAGTSSVGIGESQVAGERDDGTDVDHAIGVGSTAVPRLVLGADLDIGQLRVVNSDTASANGGDYGPGSFHEDTAPLREAQARACAAG